MVLPVLDKFLYRSRGKQTVNSSERSCNLITLKDESSTLTLKSQLSASSSPKTEPSNKQKKSKTKRVHFDISRNVEYEGLDCDRDDLQKMGLWYTPEDSKAFRTQTLKLAQRTTIHGRDGEKPWGSNQVEKMEQLHECCVIGSSKRTQSFSMESLPEVNQEEVIELVGMEPWMLPKFAVCQESRRERIVAVVLSLQYDDYDFDSLEERDGMISRKCREISKPAKAFAAVVAKLQHRSSV